MLIGGYELLELVVDVALDAPNGVGALVDMGGYAPEDVDEDDVVDLLPVPKGVGAFVLIGGYELLELVVDVALDAPNGVGALVDMGGYAPEDVDEDDVVDLLPVPKGVGAFVLIEGYELPELDAVEFFSTVVVPFPKLKPPVLLDA